jgi:hypothetical protein
MKSVVKAAEAVHDLNQLTLDFEGRAAAKQNTTTRAKRHGSGRFRRASTFRRSRKAKTCCARPTSGQTPIDFQHLIPICSFSEETLLT